MIQNGRDGKVLESIRYQASATLQAWRVGHYNGGTMLENRTIYGATVVC